jgi:dihydrofolate reductase
MRKLINFMHISLDGFTAGPNGEMNWIKLDDGMFDFVKTMTDEADIGMYGRVTFELMESYWPTAADLPNATKHDREHAEWYNNVSKVVVSKTMKEDGLKNTKVISNDLAENINRLKNQSGKNILMFGSPGLSHSIVAEGLIDELWLFVNPVLIGKGNPMFKNVNKMIEFKLAESKQYTNVVGLHYTKK